jgi:hypothetical protein
MSLSHDDLPFHATEKIDSPTHKKRLLKEGRDCVTFLSLAEKTKFFKES